METLEEIKTYIADMVAYCNVISDKDSSVKSKIAFTYLMGDVAERVKVKCDKLGLELEKELEDEQQKQSKDKGC